MDRPRGGRFRLMTLVLISFVLVVLVGVIDRKTNPRSPMIVTYLALALFYFMFGPIIAYQLGLPVYHGTDIAYIDRAALLSTICLGAFAAGAMSGALLQSGYRGPEFVPVPTGAYTILADAIFIAASLAALVLALVNLDRLGAPKDVSAFWPHHYRFLLAWTIIFIVRFAIRFRFEWIVLGGLACFSFYCVVFAERDFIFCVVSFAFLILGFTRGGALRIAAVLAVALLAVWFLALGREGLFDSGIVISLLNQSANVFVDTFTIKHVDLNGELLSGRSYIVALLKTLTLNRIYPEPPLAEWLVNEYRGPNAQAGFGFSIEAEAYINFGYAGAAVLFFVLGGVGAYLLTGERLRFYGVRVLAVAVMTIGVYAIRGESINAFKPALYIVLLIALLRVAAWAVERLLTRRSTAA